MRDCLERAVRERVKAKEPEWFSDRLEAFGFTPKGLFQRSLSIGAEGFQRSTIWRALELATQDDAALAAQAEAILNGALGKRPAPTPPREEPTDE